MARPANGILFTPDFKPEPYWWDRTPRPALADDDLPADTEVAVIGSGYTGLCAAIQIARGGRGTVVLDAEEAGWGCSSRNGGQVSTSLKPNFEWLAKHHGEARARAILREGHNALDWIGAFIAAEEIECDFNRVGRFFGAHSRGQYDKLARKVSDQPLGLEVEAHMVPRGEQYAEVATDLYYGGVVYERHASLDPARYHQGLLQRAMSSGVQVVPRCAVLQLDRVGSRHRLVTERGELSAEKVVLATSGYTGPLTPWHQRRIIPIGSYVIATEPLAEGLVETLLPTNRVVTDSRKVVVYYRASPDRRRILFGGRVSLRETDSVVSASKLHAQLIQVFPQLASVRVSHSWMGFVGYTFDEMPHLGEQDGLYYSMGYCGSGVSLASYFGTRLGQKVLGLEEGRTALDDLPFRTRAFYAGNPWFLAPTVWWYRMRDRLAG